MEYLEQSLPFSIQLYVQDYSEDSLKFPSCITSFGLLCRNQPRSMEINPGGQGSTHMNGSQPRSSGINPSGWDFPLTWQESTSFWFV